VSAQLAGSAHRYRWALIGIAALVLFLTGFLIGSARAGVSIHTGMASRIRSTTRSAETTSSLYLALGPL